VPEGAVADSIVVVGGSAVVEPSGGALPNIFARRLVKIPITPEITPDDEKLRVRIVLPEQRHEPWKKTVKKLKKLANAPCRTRTCDPRIRNPLLYPAELRAQL
jgi:hypothetical protein